MSTDVEIHAAHNHLMENADSISIGLTVALKRIGPVSFPNREDKGLAYFLCRAIVGQQLSTTAARSIWDRVESAAKESGKTIPDFFNGQNVEQIRACGVSLNKVGALQHVYEAEEQGALCSRIMRDINHKTRSEKLLGIWGIGQWTCDMASIFYCRHPDVWPETDVTVQRTFAQFINRRKPAKAAGLFAPYRSFLALSMWQIADAPP